MNVDHNRVAAKRFFELFSASGIDGALALMTKDARWRIPGKKELSPTAGLYTFVFDDFEWSSRVARGSRGP